jgi:serine/threonine-protein kinase
MDPQQGPPQPDLLIGQTIGNYLVTQKLGEGGMGSVYLAEHPAIGKKVALKVLHSEFSTNQDVANRFFQEAKAVNDIGHPNIVDVIDFGILQAGHGREQLVYFIMEYLAGATLSQLIRSEAPLPPERALTIALQVADALSASHKCGIVHRDLKPDNIILLQRGRERDFVKLLDFGIAKLTGGSAAGSHRTRTGIVMGTPAYMSPEQCEGRATVDLRTDVYALGIVIYEMLTGRVPFLGEGYGEVLVQHLTQRPTPVSQFRMLQAHVEVVVMKALEKRADMRYPTMEEFMRAMSDPVGYVEAHGGVGGFLQRQLMPSSAPITTSVRLTPAPLTPLPGRLSAPNLATPAPTTLGSSVGQLRPPSGSATWVKPAMIGVFAAMVLGIVLVIGFTGKRGAGSGDGSGTDHGSAGLGVAVGSDPGSDSTGPGSSATGSGSSATGSGSSATGPGAGSLAGGSGSAAGPGSATGGSANEPPIREGTGSGSAEVHTGSGSAGLDNPQTGQDAGSGGPRVTVDSSVTIYVSSTPSGARISVDGADTGKLTPAPLSFPRMKGKKLAITLHLKGYTSPSFKVDLGESSRQAIELLKARPADPSVVRCRTSERAGCTRDNKGCCLPEGPGSGARVGSGNRPGSGAQGSGDPDGLMKP